MKTSKKILLVLSLLLLASFTASLFVLRETGYRGSAENERKGGYETLSQKEIRVLEVGENWNVHIIQGLGFRVQLHQDEGKLAGQIHWKDNNLILEDLPEQAINTDFPIRIMAGSLQKIKVHTSARVHMSEFESDSLLLVLEDSSEFRAEKVRITHSKIETKGYTNLIFRNDEY